MHRIQYRRLRNIILSSSLALLVVVGSIQVTAPLVPAPAMQIADGPGNQNGGGG